MKTRTLCSILSFTSLLLKGNLSEPTTARCSATLLVLNVSAAVRALTTTSALLSVIFLVGQCQAQTNGQMNTDRYLHTATVLDSGQILIAGGESCSSAVCTFLNSAELYNPATDTYTYTGSMAQARSATAVLLNNGNVLIAGGYFCDASGNCSSLSSAELYNPSAGTFSSIGNMTVARGGQTMTLLTDGTVLIAGGQTCTTATSCTALSSAEIYNPVAGMFTAVANAMGAARYGASAVALNSGQVLIAGGFDGNDLQPTAEIYSPMLQGFMGNGPTLNAPLFQPTATLLNNGQVLVAGGSACGISGVSNVPLALLSTGCPTNDAEIYDPNANTFTETGGMNDVRWLQTATLLTNGEVVIAGGLNPGQLTGGCRSCNDPYWQSDGSTELFDPVAVAFNYDQSINGVAGQTATLVGSSGNVLLTGGISNGQTTSQEQWYVPGAFTPPSLVSISVTPSTFALAPGQTQQFVAVGTFSSGSPQILQGVVWTSSNPSVAVISNSSGNAGAVNAQDLGTTTITATVGSVSGSASLNVVTSTAVALASSDNPSVYGSQVTFTATVNPPTATGTVSFTDRANVLGTAAVSGGSATYSTSALPVGLHSIAASYSGDANDAPGLSQLLVETIYTASGGSPASMNTDRYLHTATVLDSGQILITGGESCSSGVCTFLSSAELYNPATDIYTYTGSMAQARSAVAVMLNNGNVLIAGGYFCDASGNCSSLSSAELYNPSAGTFSSAGNMTVARGGQTMTLLTDGTVLIAGGQTCTAATSCTALSSAEIYNPVAGTFTATANNMSAARYGASAVALQYGQVLISGGFDGNNLQPTAEIYDLTVPGFTGNGPTLNSPLFQPTATLLNNGQVLVAGGSACGISGVSNGPLAQMSTGCPTNDAEIYDPNANTFSETSGMNDSRWLQTATLLTNGQVMIAGGFTNGYCRFRRTDQACYWQSDGTTELFDPVAVAFNYDQSINGVAGQAATLVPSSGNVLLTGGISSGQTTSQEQWYQPATFTPANLVSISLSPSNFSLVPGQTQQLLAVGTFSDGSTQTLQAVVWTSSTPSVAVVSNSSGNAGTVNALALGTTTITVSVFSASASVSLSVVTTPVVTVFSSANPAAYGSQVTLTATLTASTATGTVTFMDGSTVLGTATVISGSATYSTSALAAGLHSITASYSGDAYDAPGWSPPMAQMVDISGGHPLSSGDGGGASAGAIPQFSTIEPHEYDTINLATLGIQLNVPVRSKAGHIPFSLSLAGAAQVTTMPGGFIAVPTLYAQESHLAHQINYTTITQCYNPNGSRYSGFYFTDSGGNKHSFSINVGYPASCGGATSGSVALDGSGLYMSVNVNAGNPTETVWDQNGNVLSDSGNLFTDPNGNVISTTMPNGAGVYTDTLNETATTVSISSGGITETATQTDALGNNQPVTLTSKSETIYTAFGCPEDGQPQAGVLFPTSVSFPDNSTLSFTWEKTYSNTADYTGRLASITLPTGGVISYAYSGGTNGINCSGGTPATMKRTTPDGTWTYTNVYSGSGSNPVTTVMDPSGNNIVYTFDNLGHNQQIEKQVYNGAVSQANLLETVITCYNNTNSTPANCNSTYSAYPSEKDEYTSYPGVTGYSAVKTAYAAGGLITDVKTFDFNATTPTYEKQIVYGTGSPTSQTCAAIGNYITAKPCSVTLLDSQHNNAILSQTWNSYDSHGNLLQTWNLVSGSGPTGTYLTKSYTYDSHGVIQTMTDVNGEIMNYTTTSCNNMFLTSQYPKDFPNLLTSQTWDCNGGVVTSSTDANGQTTQTVFSVGTQTDPFYRPLEDIDQVGNLTSFAYTPTTLDSRFLFNDNASVVETMSTTDSIGRPIVSQLRQGPSSTKWDTKSRTFDSDGRVYETSLPCAQGASSPCSASTESQTYDGLNRPLIHTGTGGDIVTKQYIGQDVLTTLTPAPSGENAKANQKEFDGLGRLKSVCVISSATGSGSCGQTNSKTGFLTTYNYDASGRLLQTIENAQVSSPRQTRTYTYDLIGRVLSETNPESGTVYHTYDSVSGTNCSSTSQGDMVQEVDANGNTTCHHYDKMHRETYTTYAGPNSNNVSKYFIYDAATVNGVAMTNVEGRMAEAYTCPGSAAPPCTQLITDEGFSYDQRGQMLAYYQASPNSNGYYSLTASYWADHSLNTVAGVSLPALTYGGLDGEGRVTTVSASSGTNLVSGVVYNNGGYTSEPIGVLLTTTVGNGDTQNFTYDPNTGRMTKYSASVGATPKVISGSLSWNANGTLQQNNIVDQYNSSDQQNCTYAYDDFIRAASVNCVNGSTKIWNQTFTYGTDAFGNLTKSTTGPGLSWACTLCYNALTNQYNSTLSSSIAYDSDGNLTNDTFHSYTWLADGHVAAITTPPNGLTTVSVTYDARGNKVEENNAGVIHEYVSAFGVSAQMTGQTENATIVGLPGGVEALYSGGTLQRFRFPDWQGSIRAESNPSTRLFTESLAFAPFGERYALQGAPYNVDSFTGSPDQMVSDEYDFSAREQHNGQGRWTSPDPMRGTGNKYVYADNNPLSKVDLYGLFAIVVNGVQVGGNEDSLGSVWSSSERLESREATSQEAADLVQFQCASIDCSAPGAEGMLQSMGAVPPSVMTPAEENRNQTKKAQNNEQTRANVAATADKYNGSTDWAYSKQKGAFACNTNKCNAFVGDVTKEAGAPASVTGSNGKSRYPLAAEWADKNTKIDNWRVLGKGESPQAGDVAAYKLSGGGTSYSGHSGIVTSVDANGVVHGMAAHENVVGPDNKFDRSVTPTVVYRRYTGDE